MAENKNTMNHIGSGRKYSYQQHKKIQSNSSFLKLSPLLFDDALLL